MKLVLDVCFPCYWAERELTRLGKPLLSADTDNIAVFLPSLAQCSGTPVI